LADKSTSLVIDALRKAVADPGGVRLHGGKASALFPSSPSAREAALLCKNEGYLRVLRTEAKGKTTHEICAITEKGLAFLLGQASPNQVLEDLVGKLAAFRSEMGELLTAARTMQAGFDAFQATTEKALEQLRKPSSIPAPSNGHANSAETWLGTLLSDLATWQAAHPAEDCKLADLYRQAQRVAASLTIGQFHDGLRRLVDQGKIYLHPWTGPLYDMPEPAFALLVGHEIAYYASLRTSGGSDR
jgi:hypothetical protein